MLTGQTLPALFEQRIERGGDRPALHFKREQQFTSISWTQLADTGARIQFECPYHSSVWAWADPTHVRAISEFTFLYLNQDAYRHGGIPDYRPPFDFVAERELEKIPDHTNAAVRATEPISFIRGHVVARKPLRPYWEDATWAGPR